MRRKGRIGLAVAAAMMFAGAGVQPAPAADDGDDREIRPEVTAAVQVTTNPDPARGHSTPQISRNPKTGTLVIVDCEARTKKTVDVYRSFDDGRSWSPGGSPMTKPWTDACGNPDSNIDHTVIHDKDGVMYLAFQASDPKFFMLPDPDRPVHVFLAKSTDDGATFTTVKVHDAPEAPEGDRGLKRNYRRSGQHPVRLRVLDAVARQRRAGQLREQGPHLVVDGRRSHVRKALLAA
jgi:hypothetical protein